VGTTDSPIFPLGIKDNQIIVCNLFWKLPKKTNKQTNKQTNKNNRKNENPQQKFHTKP